MSDIFRILFLFFKKPDSRFHIPAADRLLLSARGERLVIHMQYHNL